jgi:argininosuccinate lyase
MKLWGGRFSEDTDKLVEQYTASIEYDQRLAEVDIRGSIAHADMLGKTGIIADDEATALVKGLEDILEDVQAGKVEWRESCTPVAAETTRWHSTCICL